MSAPNSPSSHSKESSQVSNHEPVEDTSSNAKGGRSMSPLIIVGAVLEFIVLVLIVVATPLDVFRSKVKNFDGSRTCYSMWGIKLCGAHKVYRNKPGVVDHGFPCSSVDKLMTCAAAFAIISIFFVLLTFILALVAGCGCMSGIVPGILALFCTIFLCICFACQAGARNKGCQIGTFPKLFIRDFYKYGAAFGLSVAAFALQFIAALLILIGGCIGGGSKGKKSEAKSEAASSHHTKEDADANE